MLGCFFKINYFLPLKKLKKTPKKLQTYGSWEVFFLCSPDCPKQPRTSFPFYKFSYLQSSVLKSVTEGKVHVQVLFKISLPIKMFHSIFYRRCQFVGYNPFQLSWAPSPFIWHEFDQQKKYLPNATDKSFDSFGTRSRWRLDCFWPCKVQHRRWPILWSPVLFIWR